MVTPRLWGMPIQSKDSVVDSSVLRRECSITTTKLLTHPRSPIISEFQRDKFKEFVCEDESSLLDSKGKKTRQIGVDGTEKRQVPDKGDGCLRVLPLNMADWLPQACELWVCLCIASETC